MAQGARAVLPDRLPSALGVRAVSRVPQELRRGGRGRAFGRRAHGPHRLAAPGRRAGGPRVVPPLSRHAGATPRRPAARGRRDRARARRRDPGRLHEDPRRARESAVHPAPDVPLARARRGRDASPGPEPRRSCSARTCGPSSTASRSSRSRRVLGSLPDPSQRGALATLFVALFKGLRVRRARLRRRPTAPATRKRALLHLQPS